ncbi:UNVERIFIED_CONTAM: Peroxisomal acyl-coenzyme A oxidase 1 [Sesamum radiatum]|uniref:Acyl-coenzyme A oxidase n=1 Tax=Sesamum radiatum TaxID=300843 RepID=A0AAW2TWH9_SESRA
MEGVDYLAEERKKAEFDVESMKVVWAGSQHALEVSDRISKLVADDPAFRKDDRTMLPRKELFKNTLRKAVYAWKRIVELHLSEEEASRLRFYVDEPAFTDLHWGMFIPVIKGQGTDEQQQKWLPLAYKMQIIGCYAQTELGHGSNVQGLETTATFDPRTDEFVIHSPTLTSSKWWPGGLGKVSTHAVVFARLITDGKDHGVHGFIVQLRSLEDHTPLPGITVGDIGTKFGNGAYNTMDNGLLRFDHVRIPRNQMLMSKDYGITTIQPFQMLRFLCDFPCCVYLSHNALKFSVLLLSFSPLIVVISLSFGRSCHFPRCAFSPVYVTTLYQNGVKKKYLDLKMEVETSNDMMLGARKQAMRMPIIQVQELFLYQGMLYNGHFRYLRVSQVTREGKYKQSDVPRQLVYGTMVYVRQTIVVDASSALSKAVCIATRYSAVRRQFGSQNGGPETQVIDYKTQQSRLFPLLASAYAFRFVGEWLKWLYTDVTQSFVPMVAFVSMSLTLVSIDNVNASIDAFVYELNLNVESYVEVVCSSGLPELFAVYVPACTYEGDNIVLLLQVSHEDCLPAWNWETASRNCCLYGKNRTLMQCRCNVKKAEDWLNCDQVMEAFEARAARMSVSCARNLSKYANPEEGFAELSADLVEAAVAHCQLIVVSKFIDKLQQDIPGEGVKRQLEVLCGIYYLYLIHKHQGDFLATSYLNPKQAALANDQLRALYSQVRPNAIPLVDAFNYTDHFLGSILGRYDGNVYPKLYEAAWKDPLNETVVPDGYHEYLRPLLKQQLHSARL